MGWLKAVLDKFPGRAKAIRAMFSPTGTVDCFNLGHPTPEQLIWRVAGEVYSAISLMASVVADCAQPHLFRKNQRSTTKRKGTQRYVTYVDMDEATEIESHPLLDLLNTINPLPFGGAYEFFETVSMYLDTSRYVGFIAKDPLGVPREIWTMPPGPLRPKTSPTGMVEYWEYGYGSAAEQFKADEILLIRKTAPTTQPLDQILGCSPLSHIYNAADASNRITNLLDSMLANRCMPEVAYIIKGALTKDRRDRFREALREAQGGKNYGAPLIMGEDVDIKPVSWAPKDIMYIDAARALRELICNAFNVPVQLFTTDNVPRANLEGALYQLTKFGVKPRLRRISDVLNNTLVPMFDPTRSIFIAFPDPVPEDHAMKMTEITTMLSNHVKTINEVRKDLGIEPHPDGDELIPAPPPSLFGPPEKEKEEAEEDQEEESELRRPRLAKGYDDEHHSSKPKAPRFPTILRGLFAEQEEEVLNNIESADIETVFASFEVPGYGEVKSPPGGTPWAKGLFDEQEWIKRFALASRSTLAKQIKQGVKAGRAILKKQGMSEFNVLDPEVVAFIEDRSLSYIKRFATNVNATTAKALQKNLAQSIENGESLTKLKARIRKVYKNADESRVSAIARTETKRAREAGKRMTWEKAGVEKLQWLAGPDACPFCRKLDGKMVNIAIGKFAEQGDTIMAEFDTDDGEEIRHMHMHFGDVPHPPLHPNCTCVTVPVIE